MIKILKAKYHQVQFNPPWWGIFFNPYYFIRKSLLENLTIQTQNLSGKIMDFGCGNKPYQHLFAGKEYIGVDIEVSGHSHREAKIDVFYDGKSLPFADQTFDSVFSSEVFEHVPNLEQMLGEINRVMKPKGKLLVTVPFVWEEHETPYDFRRLTSFGLKKLLEDSSFKVITHLKTGNEVEAIFQLKAAYVSGLFTGQNIYIQILMNLIFVSPFLVIGKTLNLILPKKQKLYLNNIVLAEKND
jgi:SAM-dependent methyltransferase